MAGDKSRVALITGAAGGMGRAIIKALVADGYRIVAADRDQAGLDALAREYGASLHPMLLDVTDEARVDAIPQALPQAFRPVDVLINNAGHDIGGRKRFDKGLPDDWSNIIRTNLIGLMRVTRAILPDMVARDTGDIVFMGSINGLRIVADMAPYSASKAAVHMFVDTLRAELADTGIRIIEVNPGLTRTGIIRTRYRGDEAATTAYFEQFKIALEPDDIARSIGFALAQPRHVMVAQMVVLPINRW
jgi:3-hydroxy acid dehydrogenase / malonic semialdehyde reductase